MHEAMAATLDAAVEQIQRDPARARARTAARERPRWPMIVLDRPRAGPARRSSTACQIEGTFRAHQVPLSDPATHPEHLAAARGLAAEAIGRRNCSTTQGRLQPELAELAPDGRAAHGREPARQRRPAAARSAHARLPRLRRRRARRPARAASATRTCSGRFLRDVIKLNDAQRNFRIFGPDETLSNGLEARLRGHRRASGTPRRVPNDEFLAPDGRVMEMLSEHQCEGWLEGYLLTGRHGLFNCYEAFIHIVDSMFNQHAKWLKVTSQLPWRRKIASLNYLLASHVWRQDHNGFTHQDPGLHRPRRQQEGRGRARLPAAGRQLPAVGDGPLPAQPALRQRRRRRQAPGAAVADDGRGGRSTARAGIGIWEWASNDQGGEPDVVMACCGDVPTLETLAAVSILREHLPELKIRVVNVVDLMKLQPRSEHPHGLSDADFDALFTTDKPVIFAFHGYPWLIHRLTYRRTNHDNLHVRGYKEEGTITTPFDMTVLNDLDRFHLVMDAIDRLPQTGDAGAYLKQQLQRQADRAQAVHRQARRRTCRRSANWK